MRRAKRRGALLPRGFVIGEGLKYPISDLQVGSKPCSLTRVLKGELELPGVSYSTRKLRLPRPSLGLPGTSLGLPRRS